MNLASPQGKKVLFNLMFYFSLRTEPVVQAGDYNLYKQEVFLLKNILTDVNQNTSCFFLFLFVLFPSCFVTICCLLPFIPTSGEFL